MAPELHPNLSVSLCSEVQAATPVAGVHADVGDEDDDDEPPLNENDDDELDDLDQGEELNTQHLVLAQFDKVITVPVLIQPPALGH